MTEKKSLSARFSALVNKNSFLKVVSVLLAVVVWIYILYVINPVNDKEFNRISVDLSYEGSIPERNGYMYLLTDTNLTVSVSVSGSRSDLMSLSASDIKARLNLDPITTAGTHSVAVSISTGNKNITVTDYNPKSFTIEFAPQATRKLPIELQASGDLPNGYVIEQFTISPKEITVTGPAETVEAIDKVYVPIPMTNVKTDLSGTYDLSIVNKNGENVDRRYLTLSDTKADADLKVLYRKELEPSFNVVNNSGGNESGYISVTLDTKFLTAEGGEKVLSGMQSYPIGNVDTSLYKESGTYQIKIPSTEGITLNKEFINAIVEIPTDTGIKEITFKTSDILFTNIPTNATAKALSSIKIKIRAKSSDLNQLSSANLKCQIDCSAKQEDGSYSIIVFPITGNSIQYGVVGSYALTAEQVEIYEPRNR